MVLLSAGRSHNFGIHSFWVATTLRSAEVWGPHLLKKPYQGQIAFTQIYLWRGGLFPFLFANFSEDINVTNTILLPLFLWLHFKHSKSF